MMPEKMFPIQRQHRYEGAAYPTQIPWSVADLAYSVYRNRYGAEQSLERLAERGGFGPGEMDEFLPDWRHRCSVITENEAENTKLRAENERLRAALEKHGVHGFWCRHDRCHCGLTAAKGGA